MNTPVPVSSSRVPFEKSITSIVSNVTLATVPPIIYTWKGSKDAYKMSLAMPLGFGTKLLK